MKKVVGKFFYQLRGSLHTKNTDKQLIIIYHCHKI